MFTKLKENFKLTSLLVRVFFVIAFAFAGWRESGMIVAELLPSANIWFLMFIVILSALLVMFIVPIILNALLNLTRFYNLPRAEYCLIALFFLGVNYLILGVLSLVNYFTPILIVWSNHLFPLVSSLISTLLFYKVTSKLYFNDLTNPYYFKVCAILFGVWAVLGVVSAL